MKMFKWFLFVVILIFLSCDYSFNPQRNPEPEPPPEFAWTDEMFESEETEGGETKTIFRTNDLSLIRQEGFTLWTVFGETREPFESRTVRMSKQTGSNIGGYGIVFCHSEEEIDGETTQQMLVVMVNNNGQYIIGKVNDGTFTDFGWWKHTPRLRSVPGVSNTITVTYDEEGGQYLLLINDFEAERFNHHNLRSGRNGYIVVVTPMDNFHTSGIDVQFLEQR